MTLKAFIACAFLFPAFAAYAGDPALPESLSGFVRYGGSAFGRVVSDKYVREKSAEALQKNGSLPYGTQILGFEYENLNGGKGPLVRIILMEKIRGGGSRYSEAIRNGDWVFASFTPDRKMITTDPVSRCLSCHKGAASTDYVFGLDKIKGCGK